MVISHQERILEIADEIVVISGGTLKEMGPGAEVLPQLIADRQPLPGMCEKGGGVFMKSVTEELLKLVSDWKGAL